MILRICIHEVFRCFYYFSELIIVAIFIEEDMFAFASALDHPVLEKKANNSNLCIWFLITAVLLCITSIGGLSVKFVDNINKNCQIVVQCIKLVFLLNLS
jgi:hypothetical protein